MDRCLVANIAERNPHTGLVEIFEAGTTELPDWAAARVIDTDVWGDPAPDVLSGEPPLQEDRPGEPPRSGKGSSADAWAEYASTLGIDYHDLSRDEIIEAVDEHFEG